MLFLRRLGRKPVTVKTFLLNVNVEPSISIDSLEDLETLALENNPALAGAHAVVSGRHGRWIQAGLPSNPTIGYLGEDMGAEDTLGAQGVFIHGQNGAGIDLAEALAQPPPYGIGGGEGDLLLDDDF